MPAERKPALVPPQPEKKSNTLIRIGLCRFVQTHGIARDVSKLLILVPITQTGKEKNQAVFPV